LSSTTNILERDKIKKLDAREYVVKLRERLELTEREINALRLENAELKK